MRDSKNKSLIFFLPMILCMVIAVSCDTGERNTIEKDYEMMEGEDVPPAEERNDTTTDSVEISKMKQLRKDGVKYRKLLDSIAAANPDIVYNYKPATNGHIKTVAGDYKVEVSGTNDPEEEYTITRILQRAFQIRQEMISIYNRLYNVDIPATPANGYEAFYHEVKQNLDEPETAGLLFVQLAIERSGKISNVRVSQSINADDNARYQIEKSTIEAIKGTKTSWHPAQKNGRPVRSKVEIPIWFGGNTG